MAAVTQCASGSMRCSGLNALQQSQRTAAVSPRCTAVSMCCSLSPRRRSIKAAAVNPCGGGKSMQRWSISTAGESMRWGSKSMRRWWHNAVAVSSGESVRWQWINLSVVNQCVGDSMWQQWIGRIWWHESSEIYYNEVHCQYCFNYLGYLSVLMISSGTTILVCTPR